MKDAKGRRKQHWESVRGTKKDAERRLAEVLHQIDTGLFVRPGKSTVGEYLLAAAKKTDYYAVFHLALYTGMRRSELLALRWGDVDLIGSQISVTRSLHRLQGGAIVFQPPKTAKGRRTIALSPSATAMLREYRGQQELLAGTPSHDDQLVFSHPDGSPMQPDAVSQAWRRLVQRCGMGGVRLHDARHSHATLMLKLGIHPKVVQERLGHSSISVTLDTYSHVAPGLQESAAMRFDELFDKGVEAPPASTISRAAAEVG